MAISTSKIKDYFLKTKQKNALSHAYIFNGPKGSGKLEMALSLSQMIFCQNSKADGSPCKACNHCLRISEGYFPDVLLLEAEESSIKVDQIRALIDAFSKSGMEGSRRVFIIQDAHLMTREAANSILKFLEEPPGDSIAILLTNSINQLLPTIVSRCQVIQFLPRDRTEIAEQLEDAGASPEDARLFSYLSQELDQGLEWLEDGEFMELVKKIGYFKDLLNQKNINAYPYVQTDLKGILEERKMQNLALEILLQLFRFDLMDVQDDSELLKQASQNVEVVLKGIDMHQQYVSIQNSLEKIALDILFPE